MNDLERFLDEDIGDGDITTELFVPDMSGRAEIVCEEKAIIAGLSEAKGIFEIVGVKTDILFEDGQKVDPGTRVAIISGPMKKMITSERTALNMMMRMSGIATMTHNILTECRSINDKIVIAGTRKTTPGFREYEKKAIMLGGGDPHRKGLYDRVLIKDNHITSAGGVKNIMDMASRVPGLSMEIEVENIDDAIIAAENGVDTILIDNLPPSEVEKIRNKIKDIDPRILVEVSGGINADNASKYAGAADIISIGALTHSSKAVHFSMNLF